MVQTLLPTPTKAQTTTRPKHAAGPVRAAVKGVALAALVLLVAECLRIFAGTNFHAVVPGRCYRAAQPTPTFLQDVQRKHGIRTIINLRDENIGEDWYDAEKQSAEELHITLVNAGLSGKEQCPEGDFRKFIQALKDAQEPILIHCANGNDRSGLASAIFLLMHTDTPLAAARGQLSLRYGHVAWSKASCLHRVLDSYEKWLRDNGKEHSADYFYTWAMSGYRQETPPQ